MTLAELMVSMSLFVVIATITFVLYSDGRAVMTRSANRIDGGQRIRLALERLNLVISSAYVPPITNVGTFYESPIANPTSSPAFPPGTNTASFSSNTGQGTDSMIFFSPGDLVNTAVPLTPVVNWTFGSYDPTTGPKLYEIRLDRTYAPDTYAGYQVDQTPVGRPPLVLRTLVLRELYMPPNINSSTPTLAYLIPPATTAGSPQPSTVPLASTPTRHLGRGLSYVRFQVATGGGGVEVVLYAQDREGTVCKISEGRDDYLV